MARDTAPTMQARYDSLLHECQPARKLEIAAQLTSGARAMTEAGVRHRHPEADEDEIRRRFASVVYGNEIAAMLFGVSE